MSHPAVTVITRNTPPARGEALNTGTGFMVGQTNRGPQLTLSHNISEWAANNGPRETNSLAYDNADGFFRKGGTVLYTAREVGPTPVLATVNIPGTTGNATLTAVNSGSWGNNLRGALSGSGPYTTVITDTTDSTVSETWTGATIADLVAATLVSAVARFGAGNATGTLTAGTYAPAGGADDRSNANDTTFGVALAAFDRAYGPGQVWGAGYTTSTKHNLLDNHAQANNRLALLDEVDVQSVSTLTTAAATDRALVNSRCALGVCRWAQIRSIATGAIRVVSPACLVAGMIAASDRTNDAGTAVAGDNGILSPDVVGLQPLGASGDPTSAELDALFDAGLMPLVFDREDGLIKLDGFRTMIAPATDNRWYQATDRRVEMALTARLEVVGKRFKFGKVTPANIARLGSECAAVCQEFYTAGMLYSDDENAPEQAYRVNTGPAVNTLTTIAAGEMRAEVAVRISRHGEQIIIGITNVGVGGQV